MNPNRRVQTEDGRVTSEVGSEGGSPGDVEIGVDRKHPGVGSEATEIWQPGRPPARDIVRSDTGEGRRSP